jgi:hypothetical protein
MERVIRKKQLHDPSQIREDLNYWLSRPPAERIAAVEQLRAQVYGSSQRLQRVVRIIKRSQGSGQLE